MKPTADAPTISIAKDFSTTPGGRSYADGPFPGEKFRVENLLPALRANKLVVVDFTGIEGCGSSFLEEAFGGLVRDHDYTRDELKQRLRLTPEKSSYAADAWGYVDEAAEVAAADGR